MRPVNLLPPSDRAVRPSEGASGSSYIVLGILGGLLVAVLAFVVTQNQVNDRTSAISKTEAEAQQAEQRAAALGAFGSFAAVKQQRVQSVSELAKARFDWERFMRELALVLPDGTSLLEASASTNAASETGAAATPTPPPATGATTAPTGPTVKLVGCAESQRKVATVLVRLRELNRAVDVQLAESAEEESGGTTAPSADPAAATNTTCSKGEYKFDATVTFAPADDAGSEGKSTKAPARLGGGA